MLKVFYRSTLLITVFFTGCLLTVFVQNSHKPGKNFGSRITSWWHRRVANAFGIPIRVYGTPSTETTLYIANHISWFDIAAIGGSAPVRFLSKVEVKNMPVMGWLASRAGTLYIPRGGKSAAEKAISTMTDALLKQHHVVLFAEGTTTNGEVKRFHSRLVQSAINADCCIQPLAIRYPSMNGEKVHPSAPFVGDMTMAESFSRFLSASDLEVELHFLEPISVSGKNRGELASYAEEKVRAAIEHAQAAKQKKLS